MPHLFGLFSDVCPVNLSCKILSVCIYIYKVNMQFVCFVMLIRCLDIIYSIKCVYAYKKCKGLL